MLYHTDYYKDLDLMGSSQTPIFLVGVSETTFVRL